MAKRKGKVSKIGKSKYSYFIQLDGDGFYFNTKFDPKCGVGDVVGITYERKGDQRGQIQDVKLLEDNGGPKGYQQSAGGFSSGGGRSGGYAAEPDRQASIIYQSSRKDAVQFVDILVNNDAIKLPAGSDKRRIVLDELLDEYILKFTEAATDPAKAVKAAKGVSDDAEADWESDDAPESPEKSGDEDWADDWAD